MEYSYLFYVDEDLVSSGFGRNLSSLLEAHR
jgi:hypothetical protein